MRTRVAYFSLNESAAGRYPRGAVFGLAFSLNPGEDWIRGRDVGVTIIGSNENDYWVPGDTSVDSPFNLDPVFSETAFTSWVWMVPYPRRIGSLLKFFWTI